MQGRSATPCYPLGARRTNDNAVHCADGFLLVCGTRTSFVAGIALTRIAILLELAVTGARGVVIADGVRIALARRVWSLCIDARTFRQVARFTSARECVGCAEREQRYRGH
jgi:hypothetical protein